MTIDWQTYVRDERFVYFQQDIVNTAPTLGRPRPGIASETLEIETAVGP